MGPETTSGLVGPLLRLFHSALLSHVIKPLGSPPAIRPVFPHFIFDSMIMKDPKGLVRGIAAIADGAPQRSPYIILAVVCSAMFLDRKSKPPKYATFMNTYLQRNLQSAFSFKSFSSHNCLANYRQRAQNRRISASVGHRCLCINSKAMTRPLNHCHLME